MIKHGYASNSTFIKFGYLKRAEGVFLLILDKCSLIKKVNMFYGLFELCLERGIKFSLKRISTQNFSFKSKLVSWMDEKIFEIFKLNFSLAFWNARQIVCKLNFMSFKAI